MNADTLVLVGRVVLSLACVLGLVWFLARKLDKSGLGGRNRRTVPVSVVGRQALGGRSSVAVVEVGGRQFLLGIGEQGVSMLSELDRVPEEADEPTEEAPADTDAASDDFAAALAALTAESSATTPVTSVTQAVPTASTAVAPTTSAPAARTPAVPTHRSPLEGSVLSATTWRRAMAAVQERTTRH